MKKIIYLVSAAILCGSTFVKAQSQPFLGQIAFVPYNFAPKGWAPCNGQLLPIMQNTALFSLLGTTYGGNGQTTFALPDMRGRAIVHEGQGAGLTTRTLGEQGGTENVTLTINQIPAHTHQVTAVTAEGNNASPTGNIPANTKSLDKEYSSATADTTMGATMIAPTGGNQPHPNMSPFLTLKCIIALEGIFPSQN